MTDVFKLYTVKTTITTFAAAMDEDEARRVVLTALEGVEDDCGYNWTSLEDQMVVNPTQADEVVGQKFQGQAFYDENTYGEGIDTVLQDVLEGKVNSGRERREVVALIKSLEEEKADILKRLEDAKALQAKLVAK